MKNIPYTTRFMELLCKKEEWKEYFQSLFWALLLAVVFRSFLFEPFKIPSDSMVPTVLTGDYIFVSKYSYGYSRHSLPFSFLPIEGKIFKTHPERGDVVVFKTAKNDGKHYIKRVIGLPEDRIQMVKGVLHINNMPVPLKQEKHYVFKQKNQSREILHFTETLPEGVKHPVLEETRKSNWYDTAMYVVPKGHYFMMGDNRNNSADSRSLRTMGYVPEANIIGKAGNILSSETCPLWGFWRWGNEEQCGRLFKKIH